MDAVHRIAEQVAAPAASSVDRDARFPREALQALRDERLLGALVPRELGGLGESLSSVARMTDVLGRACAATGMVFAMHQIKVACLVRHARAAPWFERYLEELAAEQRLIASVTSEVGVGGDLRSSIAAVRDGMLEKHATTVSYGEHADDLLLTARRDPDGPPGDQVLVLAKRGDFTLERTGPWNTLGMRGTCSPGFIVQTRALPEQIVPAPFAEIASQTMVPVSHLLWSSVWLGIATDALGRAHAFVRAQARKSPGSVPPGALRLAEAGMLLDTFRARVEGALAEYERLCASPDGHEQLAGIGYAIRQNALKISAAELVLDVVRRALAILGMAGYREDGDLAVGRHLRDACSAALMINNDRIYGANASLLLVQKELG